MVGMRKKILDQENNTIVIYHANCTDGFTAAWAAWLTHPDWEYIPIKYGYPLPSPRINMFIS